MSLMALLESSKQVAMETREQIARQNAEDVAEFEEFGADLAAALDAQELEQSEEALKLSQELDDKEEEEVSERERADLELAKSLLESDEQTIEACDKDEMLAQQLEAQLKKEMVRVAKLERRERQLAEKKLCQDDVAMAERLAAEILEEEERLRAAEVADRRLAAQLVKDEQQVLKALPQTEETLRSLSTKINGDPTVPLRSKLRSKLNALYKALDSTTKGAAAAQEEQGDKENGDEQQLQQREWGKPIVVATPREPLTHQW